MVTIRYYRKQHRLTAKGHAGSGRKGHDLVCAAISALVLTLAANVMELAAEDQVYGQTLRLMDGSSCISCVSHPETRSLVTLVFDTVCTGFELLETLYSENIRYEMIT